MAEHADPGTGDHDTANSGTMREDVRSDAESPHRTLTDLMDELAREAFSRYLDHTHPFPESSADKT